jgi:hypothetical protein
MATILFMRETTGNAIGSFRDAVTTAGSSTTTGVVTLTNGGSNIQWTKTAGGAALEWISGRSPVGGWTLSGLVSVQLRALESNANDQAQGRIRLYKRTSAGSETELTGSPWDDGVEMGTTNTALTWTFTPTSMAFAENDRLVIRFFVTNVGGAMTTGTATMSYDGAAAGTGDTRVQINENVTFKNEERTGTLASTLGAITLVATGTVSNTPNVYWSATNKSAAATLSNSNLTGSHNGGSGDNAMGRSDTILTGKTYYELTVNQDTNASSGPGLANATEVYNVSGRWPGQTVNTVGFYSDGSVYHNWGSTGTTHATGYATYTTGSRLGIAVDIPNGKIWIRVNNGNWNNNAAHDPATNTGGLDFASLIGTGNIYHLFNVHTGGTPGQVTANFGASSFVDTPPSGFVAVDSVVTSTGTASITLDPITLAATGVTPKTGTASITLDAITLAATGTIPSQGTLASTLSAITLVGTGTVANQVFTGTLATTFDPITLAATGNIPSQGTLSSTLGAITLVGTGNIPSQGTLAATFGDITLTSTVKVFVQGSLTATLADITLVGTGEVLAAGTDGTLASTLGDITLVAAGSVLVRGTVAATLGDVTLAAVAAALVKGTFAATLGDITATGTGNVIAGGIGNGTFGAMTLAATGKVIVGGSFLQTLDPITLAATVVVPIVGTLNVTFDPIVLSASSSPFTAGVLGVTFDPITLAATGTVPAQGTLNVTLDELTTVALGTVVIRGTVAATLDPIVLTGEGTAPPFTEGSLVATLDEITLVASGSVPAQGIGEITFGEFSLVAQGVIPLTATLNVTFDPITLAALGSVYTPGETVPIVLSGTLSPNVVLVGVLVEGRLTMAARVPGTTALGASTAGPVDLEGEVPANPEV